MVEKITADWLQIQMYERAGFDPMERAPSVVALAERLIGPECVRQVPASYPLAAGGAEGMTVRGRHIILLSEKLAPAERDFVIAHEIAEWYFQDRIDDEVEQDCDTLAACLCAPHTAFLRAQMHVGQDLPRLAKAFRVTQSCAVLRIGETRGTPVALVSEQRLRTRGRPYPWTERRKDTPGIRKVKLSDAAKRTALFAETG